MRTLQAMINGQHVATLTDNSGSWQLEYSPAWVKSEEGYDLSPRLPRASETIVDGSSERPVQWFFDNLLPEEQSRQLLAGDAKIEFADAFGLLGYYGAESAGAITLLAEPDAVIESGLRPLTDMDLSRRINNLPRVALTTDAPKRMSLAGAQYKLPVVLIEQQLYEPVGNTPSTHILKPNHSQPDDYDATVANEWFVMRLAQEAGMEVPNVSLRRVPEAVYLIERFDRSHEGDQVYREHVLDGCQLLGLDRHFKYQQANTETLNKILGLVRNRAQVRLQLFRWLVFNLLVGNNDAHLKNLSFFVKPDGYRLAPHYDLLCTAIYGDSPTAWLGADLVWKTDGMRTHEEVSRAAVLRMGREIGITEALAARHIDEIVHALEAATAKVLAECESQLTAGENRLLLRIVHGVIRDMAARLR